MKFTQGNAGDVARWIVCLPSLCKVLGSIPSTTGGEVLNIQDCFTVILGMITRMWDGWTRHID
jgi:hypothetical protein